MHKEGDVVYLMVRDVYNHDDEALIKIKLVIFKDIEGVLIAKEEGHPQLYNVEKWKDEFVEGPFTLKGS